ncbi:Hypothetical predicted protein [Pelobates cultripes]|uniref:Uncharacterized protein n=1 Tax=Pelobates cultripes TaxID=61616 RepID=A0AAD1WQK9_PELCU|nr:Hypothetical predicted protein [Pelobates cultripes]
MARAGPQPLQKPYSCPDWTRAEHQKHAGNDKQMEEFSHHRPRSPPLHKLAPHKLGLPQARSTEGWSVRILLGIRHNNYCAQKPQSLRGIG